MTEPKEPSPDQTQPSIQDGDGERRLSSNTKRLKLITNKLFCLNNERNMNVGNDELKASVQSQGEETAQVNLQENPELATSGIAKPLYADADNAAEDTAMRTSGDIIAHGDELTNIGEVEDNLDGKNTTIWQSEGGNNACCLDDESSPLSDLLDLSDFSDLSDSEWVVSDISKKPLCEDLGLVNDGDIDDHEQEFYKIENPGEEDLRVIPIAGGEPWSSLPSQDSATLDDWKFNIGDVVHVRCTGNQDSLAKVFDIRYLGPESYLVVLVWYYTRDEIEEELQGHHTIPKRRQAHLDAQWPVDAPFTHMLSSNRTINMWDTIRGKASPEAMAYLCPDKFYVTTESIRKICKAGHQDYRWMRELLYLARHDN